MWRSNWCSALSKRRQKHVYSVVPAVESDNDMQRATPETKQAKGIARRYFVLLLAVCIACVVFYLVRQHNKVTADVSIQLVPKHLRLIIPASQSNTRLCKTLISAAVLGYPAPILVNWQRNFTEKGLVAGGSHLAKIRGVLDHLKTVLERDHNDLVMIMDGYDTWLQLRPEVAINRYYAINRLANARIYKQLGRGMEQKGIEQKVVFSAQKRCWPKRAKHPACYAVPESPLPPNVYGPDTDTKVKDAQSPYVKYRQRYLNSGFVIGPVKDVIAIFERAQAKAEVHPGFGSDQAIFADMFGQQELQRHAIARRYRSWVRLAVDWLTRHDSASYEESAEFGIGLDYKSELALPTVFCENDTEWLSFNEKARISKISQSIGLAKPRIGELSQDIATSEPPFYSLRYGPFPLDQPQPCKTWGETTLFTNIWTGVVPVAMHHNAHIDGLKSRIETDWNRTWFQSNARTLLNARAVRPMQAVAKTTWNGQSRAWWAAGNMRSGVLTDTDDASLSYNSICTDAWEELFTDGRGPWVDPRRPGAS